MSSQFVGCFIACIARVTFDPVELCDPTFHPALIQNLDGVLYKIPVRKGDWLNALPTFNHISLVPGRY